MVVDQWRQALRISAFLYILLSLVSIFLLMLAPPSAEAMPNQWLLFLGALAGAFAFIWIAIGWHRYILLDETPTSFVPQFRGDRVLAYLGYSLVTGIIGGLIALAGILVVMVIAMATGPLFATVGVLVAILPIFVVAYRLAPVFPAAALGRKTSIGEAWASTRGAVGAFIVLAIISTIASAAIDLPANLLRTLPAGGILSLLWLTVTGWIKVMIRVSILTTIYGHYVERRAIK
jgi:hypothetical protein